MHKFIGGLMLGLLLVICMTLPAWAESQILTRDSGPWTVEINADSAVLTVKGIESSFSVVQVTVQYMTDQGLCEENTFPVNVLPLASITVAPQKDGFYIKRITFECTKGKVTVDAVPGSGSFA